MAHARTRQERRARTHEELEGFLFDVTDPMFHDVLAELSDAQAKEQG